MEESVEAEPALVGRDVPFSSDIVRLPAAALLSGIPRCRQILCTASLSRSSRDSHLANRSDIDVAAIPDTTSPTRPVNISNRSSNPHNCLSILSSRTVALPDTSYCQKNPTGSIDSDLLTVPLLEAGVFLNTLGAVDEEDEGRTVGVAGGESVLSGNSNRILLLDLSAMAV